MAVESTAISPPLSAWRFGTATSWATVAVVASVGGASPPAVRSKAPPIRTGYDCSEATAPPKPENGFWSRSRSSSR